MALRALLLLVACLLTLRGAAQTPDAEAQAAAEYAARAGRTVATLAGDSLAGRGYGPADGARRAARYLASRFRALGLEPLGDSAGHSYYQHFTLPVNTFPGPMGVVLIGGRQRPALRPGYDVIAAPDCPSVQCGGRIAVFDTAWLTLDSATLARRLRPRSLRGRVLVLRAQDEKRLPGLGLAARRWVASARAVLVLEPRKLTASLAPRQRSQPWLRVLDSAWRRGPVPRRAIPYVTAHLEPAYPAMNIVGRLRGTGATRADSILLVTAHSDHLGQQGPDVTFYGANDNASGTAMLLELMTWFNVHRPRHDWVFIAFGAEEAGLVGSQWSAAHPPVPLPTIRFLLNLDLEGFGDGATVVNATLHPRRFRLLDSLSRAAPAPAAAPPFVLKQRGRAANSDHYPFSERGVPACFVYSRGGPGYYHDVRDRPATLDLARAYGLYYRLRDFLIVLDTAP